MNFLTSDLSAALPEIWLLGMACLILVIDLFISERLRIVTFLLVELTLVVAFIITLPQFKEYPQPILLFSGNYVVDKLAVLSKLVMYVFSFFSLIYSRDYISFRGVSESEYYLLSLFAVLGMSIMASAYTFLVIYLGLELLSLALYAMVAMNKKSNMAGEAAMKYFVLGSLASGILLYGISLLYGVTGEIQIDKVAGILAEKPSLVTLVALIFVMGGIIFKFGAVPFHMWVPDVYEGASTPTTLFIASAPKVAAFAITVRILVQAMPSLEPNWQVILIVIAMLSMFLGNLLAIAQSNLKRMLAYSSIAHIGYSLLGIIAGPHSTQGYSAAMFYISTYVLVAAGAFAVITLLSRQGVEFDKLNNYRGLNERNPWVAFMMLLLMFSMAGVPPTVGFFAKLGLLEALVQANLVWLAVWALIFALIGAYYYLRVVMLMYFEHPTEEARAQKIIIPIDMFIALSVNGVAALMLGLFPSFLIDICRITVG